MALRRKNQPLKELIKVRDGGGRVPSALKPMLGIVGELGCIDDPNISDGIGRLMGSRLQLAVFDLQQEVVKFKEKFPGISVVALQAVSHRFAPDKDVDRDSAQALLKMERYHPERLPPGACFAVNQIMLSKDQLAMNLRQRLWYFLLGSTILFQQTKQMNEYISSYGLNCDMIALDTMEVARGSGIQQGGAAPSRHVLMATSCYLDRFEYQQAAKELETVRSVLEHEQKAVDVVEASAIDLEQVLVVSDILIPSMEGVLRFLCAAGCGGSCS